MDPNETLRLLELMVKALNSLGDPEKTAASYPRRVVAHYENPESGLLISTASVTDGFKPFETGVTHPRYNSGKWMIVEAYETEEQAESGHYRWLKRMTGDGLPEVIPDAVNCVAAQCVVEADGQPLEYRLDATR